MLVWLLVLLCGLVAGQADRETPLTLDMYNSIAQLMGEAEYPAEWWQQRKD